MEDVRPHAGGRFFARFRRRDKFRERQENRVLRYAPVRAEGGRGVHSLLRKSTTAHSAGAYLARRGLEVRDICREEPQPGRFFGAFSRADLRQTVRADWQARTFALQSVRHPRPRRIHALLLRRTYLCAGLRFQRADLHMRGAERPSGRRIRQALRTSHTSRSRQPSFQPVFGVP